MEAVKRKLADANSLTVSKAEVAQKFGISVSDLEMLLGDYAFPELNYHVLEGAARDVMMLGILKRVEEGKLRVVGENDNAVWLKGWGEILENIEKQGFSFELLRPQYFDHHRFMRFNGEYIDGGDASFVYQYDQLLRRLTLAKYLQGQTKVVELGCGTGTSQRMLAELLPNAELVASDWAKPSQGIIAAMGKHLGRAIKPVNFNMLTLEGYDQLGIDANTAVLTVHALEQIGDNVVPLMDKLIASAPKLCVHLEPIVEAYDNNNLFDYLAIKYHMHRNYLSGWLTRLRTLEDKGVVKILEERRLSFGDRYHEAYTVVSWKPL